jgi:hypothetical protein
MCQPAALSKKRRCGRDPHLPAQAWAGSGRIRGCLLGRGQSASRGRGQGCRGTGSRGRWARWRRQGARCRGTGSHGRDPLRLAPVNSPPPCEESGVGDGDAGVGPSMMAAERGERGRGCAGGVGPSISTRGPSFLGAAARGWRCAGSDLP